MQHPALPAPSSGHRRRGCSIIIPEKVLSYLVIGEEDGLQEAELPDPRDEAALEAPVHLPGAEAEEHDHDDQPGHEVGPQAGRDPAKFIPDVEWVTVGSIVVFVALHTALLLVNTVHTLLSLVSTDLLFVALHTDCDNFNQVVVIVII